MKKIYLVLIIVGVVFGGIYLFSSAKKESFRGYLVPTVTNASSSVGTGNTAVIAAGAGLQYLSITNLGAGQIFCASGATATLNTGLVINATSSYSGVSLVITEPNILMKTLNCIATATSTIAILRF